MRTRSLLAAVRGAARRFFSARASPSVFEASDRFRGCTPSSCVDGRRQASCLAGCTDGVPSSSAL
eukprot:6176006-Pleurochrysis_carterae.AAC.2